MVEIDEKKIGIIILAAGESRRFGSPKQLIDFYGGTLLNWIIHNAIASELPTTVVLGAYADEIRESIDETNIEIVINENWENGIGSSISTGLGWSLENQADLDAVIFLLCDQPLVTMVVVSKLIMAQKASGREIVASEYEDSLGVPALFTQAMFGELLELDKNLGAKSIIEKHPGSMARVFGPENRFDIDTPQDLERLRSIGS